MKNANVIGAAVRRLRNERGWSQNTFAVKLQLAGMEDATREKIAKIEGCTVFVRDEHMVYLAGVLGVEPNDLYPKAAWKSKRIYEAVEGLKKK